MMKNSERGKYTNPEGSAFWEYAAALSSTSLVFCIGITFGWSSPVIDLLMRPESTISFTETDASIMSTTFSIGYMLGPALNTIMADKLGRRNSLLVISVPSILQWGLIAVAKDTSVFYIARLLGASTAGLGLCLIPMYLGEVASAKLRGVLGMFIGTASNSGGLCVFAIVPYMSISTSACLFLSISVASMISIWFIPESPYFLAMISKMDEAEHTLEKLRGKTDVSEELDLIKRTLSEGGKEGEPVRAKPSQLNLLKELFKTAGNRRALYINLLFIFLLQYGGYVTMMSFGHVILKAMKTGVSTNLSANIFMIIQLVFNILTTFVIDRFGRRPFILISGMVSGGCLLIVGVYLYLLEHTDVDVSSYGLVALIASFVNIAAISVGLMPMQLLIRAEIIAPEVSATTNCVIGVLSGLASFVPSALYLPVVSTWGYGHSVPFLAFTFITCASTVLILKMLPETRGRTFLEIQKDLNA